MIPRKIVDRYNAAGEDGGGNGVFNIKVNQGIKDKRV